MGKTVKLMGLILCCVSPLLAGRSIVLSAGSVGNTSIPAQVANGACRMEFSVHDWPAGVGDSHPMDASACGFSIGIYGNGGSPYFAIQDNRTNYGASCRFNLYSDNFDTYKFITIRFQRDPVLSINTCEAWDALGNYYTSGDTGYAGSPSAPYTATSGTNTNGACVSGSGWWGACVGGSSTLSTAYYRLYTTTVAAGSTPPTTAQSLTGCLVSWKFDLGNNTGSLNDSCSAGPYNASVLVGSYSYAATPYQILVKAFPKASNIPSWDQGWATWISARLNSSNGLDGTSSYSQADASATVTCAWTYTGTPSQGGDTSLTINNASLCGAASGSTVTYTPTAMGTHTFTLVATDAASNTGTASIGIGAVAYDGNGVIIPQSAAHSQMFGPMIAFGANPWGYEDERDYSMVGLQTTYFQAWGLNAPSWKTYGQGTVAYQFSGIGFAPSSIAGTTLTSGITATAMSVSIADASKLPGLVSLPEWIKIAASAGSDPNYAGAAEEVQICGTTATSGAATLTVCYNGRGNSAYSHGGPGGAKYLAAQAWSSGATVGEYRINGTGTKFLTDSNRAICPAGAGPAGPIVYSTGTVTMTAGSNAVVGSGTTFASSMAGQTLRVSATHSGTGFVFWSLITSYTDATHVTLDKAFPSDADAGSYSFAILGYNNLSMEFQFTDPTDGTTTMQLIQSVDGCASETVMFGSGMRDIPALNGSSFSGMRYSWDDHTGINNPNGWGPNFYGSGLALYQMWLRSGWDAAYTPHQWMDENFVTSPEVAGGFGGGFVLAEGGGYIGAIATLATDSHTSLIWPYVRTFIQGAGGVGSVGCDADDSRDTGYAEAWLTLGALFDPSSTQRTLLNSYLGPIGTSGTVLYRENSCKRPDNSWSNGFLFGTTYGPLTLTNGSAAVTGSGIPSGACYGAATVSVAVTNGVSAFTGTGLVDGAAIWINGTTSGVSTPMRFEFTHSGSTSGALAVLWPGDSGTFTALIENNGVMSAIGTSSSDYTDIQKNYGCTWNSSSSVTLSRPWQGATGSSYYLSHGQGYGQQPYMLGIKTQAFRWGSYLSDSSLATGFASLATASSGWIQSTGYDPQTQGLYYFTGNQACGPTTAVAVPAPNSFSSRNTTYCNLSLGHPSQDAARTLTAEAGAAIGVNYTSQSYASSAKTWGDIAYGSIWGYCPYTAPGYYCDANYVYLENSNSGLSANKWPGFFFGMGMAHQWPAARLTQFNQPPGVLRGTAAGAVIR